MKDTASNAFTAAILAGGKSSRFGQDKAFFEINDRPLIEHIANKLNAIFDSVIAIGGNIQRMREIGLQCYPDQTSGRAVLSGLHTALEKSTGSKLFLCACDMPLLNRTVIERLIQFSGDETILLPMIDGKRQPLHAIYARSILPAVEKALRDETVFLPQLLYSCCPKMVEEKQLENIPDYKLSFVNINHPDELLQHRSHLNKL